MSCPIFTNRIEGYGVFTETGCGFSARGMYTEGWKFCPKCGGTLRPITDAELSIRAAGKNWNETITKEMP